MTQTQKALATARSMVRENMNFRRIAIAIVGEEHLERLEYRIALALMENWKPV